MTAAELREKKGEILNEFYLENLTTDQALDALDLLDAQRSISRTAFYAMVDQFDTQRSLLLASQGNETQQTVVIDMIIDLLTHYAESLKGVTA